MDDSHAEGYKVACRIPAELHRYILCTEHSGGTAHEGVECDQSIGFTVSDAIVVDGCGRLRIILH